MRTRVLGFVILLAACSPYEPSLPGQPFLCGDKAPRCPDGYTCVTSPSGAMVCSNEEVPDAGASEASAPGAVDPRLARSSQP